MPRALDHRERAAMQEELLTRLAQKKLEPFVEQAWPILEPGTAYRSNWHIGLICEWLEAVTLGQVQQLVINMPPRYGKSLLTSILWPVWEWIAHPTRRWLFVSHSETLAHRHSLDRRRVLLDEWFRCRFPHVRLTADQNAKAEFHNTKRGAMIATSMGGPVTGKGGDRLVIDDPHSPEQVESDLQRQHAVDRFRSTLVTRLDDKRLGAIVVVMQRLHTQDLSGVCLDLGFQHLCLEAIASRRQVITYPLTKRAVIREADELLWPERENRNDLDRLRIALGAYGFAGQYQQQPVPRSGGLFPREEWGYYQELPVAPQAHIIQSWDLSLKGGDGSDFVVGLVAARIGTMVYILDRFKRKASFVETCQAIRNMLAKYPTTSAVLVEDAANGPAVVDALKSEIPGLIAVHPEGGKEVRAVAVQGLIHAKQVLLPSPFSLTGESRGDRLWVEDLVAVCAAFPKGAHDDDVDALTQLLVWVLQHPHVDPASTTREPEPKFSPRFRVFRESWVTVGQPDLRARARRWAGGGAIGFAPALVESEDASDED